MSLKPRHINFQETWANLKETVAGVVELRRVERGTWNLRFSDVYALCVAQPEPLADRLYDETRAFLEEHVRGLLVRVRGDCELGAADHTDGLLHRYYKAWQEYSQGVAYLNNLYSYLNLQHIKRQKISEAELIYGSAATAVVNPEHDGLQLEVGELGLSIWERELIRPLGAAISARLVSALIAARNGSVVGAEQLRGAVQSTLAVRAHRPRDAHALYDELVLSPYLRASSPAHARRAAALLAEHGIARYLREAGAGLAREAALGELYLRGPEPLQTSYQRAVVWSHLGALHAHAAPLLRAAAAPHADAAAADARADLGRLYRLLRPLGAAALQPLVDAALAQAAADGRALLDDPHSPDEAHTHFVKCMLALHGKYSSLFGAVFAGSQAFAGALDKACAQVVNARASPHPARAPELLARYCDALLRRRAAPPDADAEDKLAGAILVFKYLDDKDVFQKYYARTLARRLIHQLSASMELEEGMIARLKAACGYEFTNKLHRMFTDVALSADLNAKFLRHLPDERGLGVGFNVQVLQAGAWPLGGAVSPLAPPPSLERACSLFDAFYRGLFSGRRLAWLHHLCTGELRTKYTPKVYHVQATVPQCALLLCFDAADHAAADDLQAALQLADEAWARHAKPMVDCGLLTAAPGWGLPHTRLALNMDFHCKRSRVKVTCTGGVGSAAASGETPAPSAGVCEEDRKMYLQAALVRTMKQRKILKHNELIQEVVAQARGSFAPSVAMIKKCIEALIDKQYLERTPGTLDTYAYLA